MSLPSGEDLMLLRKLSQHHFITPHARRPLSLDMGMNGASELQGRGIGVLFACLPFQFPAHLLE
jgi:hypothetical protein